MRKKRRYLRVLMATVKATFIVVLVFAAVLFFRDLPLPTQTLVSWATRDLPTNLVLRVASSSFGLRTGLQVNDLHLYDRAKADPLEPVFSLETLSILPLSREIEIVGARYPSLPDGYYAPVNLEKNARVEGVFPALVPFKLRLIQPDILNVRPREVTADVQVSTNCVSVTNIRLEWPDTDVHMALDGFCRVDLGSQEIAGEVHGLAKQAHIRPMLVALDVPVSLPYMDAFTEVADPVPASCGWLVNLVNNDFDLGLKLHPTTCRYNGVPMDHADGDIRLHVYTRGTNLNYVTTVGPLAAADVAKRPLAGSVVVSGLNGYNVVDVEAQSGLPIADILKIGGFTGEYVDSDVIGRTEGRLQFRFPRAMTNNYEVLNGNGHVVVLEGQLMRLKGFAGLVELMAEKVPGVNYLTDRTRASVDYVIRDGVLSTENIFIEGGLFSIKMAGSFDTVKDSLDFTVRVQFFENDSVLGKVVHPVTWVFTKLLLEFRLTGSAANPKWDYVTVLDRVMEVVK